MPNSQLHCNRLKQLSHAFSIDDTINAVSLNDQETSTQESKQPSSRNHIAVVQAAIETALIIIGLMAVALLLPRQTGPDGSKRYQDLVNLLSTHRLFQPHSRYSLIGPVFSTPLLWIGEQLGQPQQWICLYNLTLFAFCLLASYFLLRNHVDRALLRKFFLVLIYGSMFIAHLTFYYGEVFTALCVGFGVLVAFMRLTTMGGWLIVVLGVVNTPATLIGLGIMVLKSMFDKKRLRYAVIFVLAALCIFVEAWVRRGSIFNSGYAHDHGLKNILPFSGLPDFSYPFFFGLLSILFSFGKGLLFFTPGLLLPIRKTVLQWSHQQSINLYQVYILWMCFLLGLILAYSPWWDWSGAAFWGPRFFLFASIPASFALAVRLIHYKEASLGVNLLTFGVYCLSAWVSVDGAVFQLAVTHPRACMIYNHAWEMLCSYTPDYSPLWMPFIFHLRIYEGQAIFLLFSLLVATYLAVPLFLHLLKQLGDFTKKHRVNYMNVKLWRI